MTKKIEIPKDKLEKYYIKKGLSSYKIADIYKCNPSVIQNRLNEYNIPLIHKKEETIIPKAILYNFYINKKLSIYKIAKIYNCAHSGIYRKLKINKIKTRSKKIIPLSKDQLIELYVNQKLSSPHIAKRYSCADSAILDKLIKYNIPRRNASEAKTIYPKKPFGGDPIKKAHMIGFRLGDLHVKKNGKNSRIIRINCNTTKLAQVNLIREVFGCYGHFYTKSRGGVHEVSCQLHNNFSFLLPKEDNIPSWILENKDYFFAFLAGYTDAEGCIKISQGRARYRIGSYDKNLLRQIYEKLNALGLGSKYNLETKAGVIYGRVRNNGDFWRVSVNNKLALLKLFEFLEPLMKHSSKIKDLKKAKKNILNRNKKFGIKYVKKCEYSEILTRYPDLKAAI